MMEQGTDRREAWTESPDDAPGYAPAARHRTRAGDHARTHAEERWPTARHGAIAVGRRSGVRAITPVRRSVP